MAVAGMGINNSSPSVARPARTGSFPLLHVPLAGGCQAADERGVFGRFCTGFDRGPQGLAGIPHGIEIEPQSREHA